MTTKRTIRAVSGLGLLLGLAGATAVSVFSPAPNPQEIKSGFLEKVVQTNRFPAHRANLLSQSIKAVPEKYGDGFFPTTYDRVQRSTNISLSIDNVTDIDLGAHTKPIPRWSPTEQECQQLSFDQAVEKQLRHAETKDVTASINGLPLPSGDFLKPILKQTNYEAFRDFILSISPKVEAAIKYGKLTGFNNFTDKDDKRVLWNDSEPIVTIRGVYLTFQDRESTTYQLGSINRTHGYGRTFSLSVRPENGKEVHVESFIEGRFSDSCFDLPTLREQAISFTHSAEMLEEAQKKGCYGVLRADSGIHGLLTRFNYMATERLQRNLSKGYVIDPKKAK